MEIKEILRNVGERLLNLANKLGEGEGRELTSEEGQLIRLALCNEIIPLTKEILIFYLIGDHNNVDIALDHLIHLVKD